MMVPDFDSGSRAPIPDPRSSPVVEIVGLRKVHAGLRPLRVEQFVVHAEERVALTGLDVAAAEALVNVLAGATLPDAGEVRMFGASTRGIGTSDEWLRSLERLGMVSHRAVLLEGMTVLQNVALSLTLQLEPVPEPHAGQARALASQVGIPSGSLDRCVGHEPPSVRFRVHLARAIALGPSLLLLEHPTVDVAPDAADRLAADVSRVAEEHRLAMLALTNDERFARAACHRTCRLRPATGAIETLNRRSWPWPRWRRRT